MDYRARQIRPQRRVDDCIHHPTPDRPANKTSQTIIPILNFSHPASPAVSR
ncbi:hypothetical protein H6G52_15990 [Limnothrix sp. FACHB-881]|uniref:hypothetical protein n=1 Tax=Limnothrix sp. FACHB-881 TaxID=2692819 RepID=UPI0016837199|nr:hypothetical protein [Limnothrix sp. FACHB-881]MBD2636869.1 hypothetical protein [Limnothrix sp. FACHB-881]